MPNFGISDKSLYVKENGVLTNIKLRDMDDFGRIHWNFNAITYLIVKDSSTYESLKKNYLMISNFDYHIGEYGDIIPEFKIWDGAYPEHDFVPIKSDTVNVLYVTTYQGENFRFRQDKVQFNIEEKIAQLDKYLSE